MSVIVIKMRDALTKIYDNNKILIELSLFVS